MRARWAFLLASAAFVAAVPYAERASAQVPPIPTTLPPIPTGLPGLPPVPVVPGPTGGGKVAKITSAKPEGDLRLSAGLGVDAAGALSISMAAIKHPDLPGVPVNPLFANVTISAQLSGSLALSCSIGGVSSSHTAPVDLVFVNDTTGSMSGTVNGISDSIKTFAQKVAAGGIDARFSMYTYGDAFATRGKPGKFYVGKGDFDPPSFDNIARPYVGLSDLGTFEKFLGEMKTSGALGQGGGDSAENTLGALQYADRHLGYRPGAAHVFVVVGDNPSHQKGDGTSNNYGPNWLPPSGEDVVSELSGRGVVHVVGKDTGKAPYYNLKNLADATGGEFKPLPKDGKVDLTTLGLDAYLTSGYKGICTGLAAGSIDVTIRATVVGKKVYVGTLAFKVVVS
ncbi:MAG: VWA domain-containing protein [Verrucomicrobia bacterium]|nr:VWA domain-containing protein [Verrucomicrobiota bacterium]